MAVHIDPERFQGIASKPLSGSQYLHHKERENLLEKGVKTRIEGDVYIQEGVHLARQSKQELRMEVLEKPQLHPDKGQRFVAFRNPDDTKEVLVVQLDSQTLRDLKEAFSKEDFFARSDDIIRLKGSAERYVAGWLKEIVHKRGYGEADANKNGIIEAEEQNSLRIGFDKDVVYEHAGKEVTAAGTSVGARRYQSYGNTLNANNPVDFITTQALKFKRTVAEELNHTLAMDSDKNGIVTLEEGLSTFTSADKNVHETLKDETKRIHQQWIDRETPVLEPNRLSYRDLSLPKILTQQEREAKLEAFKLNATSTLEAAEAAKEWIESINSKTLTANYV